MAPPKKYCKPSEAKRLNSQREYLCGFHGIELKLNSQNLPYHESLINVEYIHTIVTSSLKLDANQESSCILAVLKNWDIQCAFDSWRTEHFVQEDLSVSDEIVGGYVLILNSHVDHVVSRSVKRQYVLPFWCLATFLVSRALLELLAIAELAERILN